MKKGKFKIVSFVVIFSLICLVVYQGFSMFSVYREVNKNFEQQVKNAMYRALLEEDKINFKNKENSQKITSLTFPKDSLNSYFPTQNIKSITIVKANVKLDGNYKLLNLSLNLRINNSINGKNLDSLFNLFLNEYNIDLANEIQLSLNSEKDSILYKSNRIENIKNPKIIESIYKTKDDELLTFTATFENPNSILFFKMGRILGSSIVITLLLIFSFIYLLKTLFKYKSLTEIKKDFTHNITHELKTPISVAYAATDSLINIQSIQQNQIQRDEYLNIISQQLNKLKDMVDNILSVSLEDEKKLQLNKSYFNLSQTINEVSNLHSITIAPNAKITLSLPDELFIVADKFHLSNTINTLIDNAIKYSPNDIDINITAYKEGKTTYIKVTDKGIGIKPENQKHIFEKFYRVPTGDIHNVKGYGIGLYYAKEIISKHGGSIKVKSQYQKGSTFTIELKEK